MGAHFIIGEESFIHQLAHVIVHHLQGELIVIAQEGTPLAAFRKLGQFVEDGVDRGGVAKRQCLVQPRHNREVEDHVEALALAIELHGFGRRLVGLRDEHRIRVVGVHEGANLLHKLDCFRQGLAAYTIALKEICNGIEAQAVQTLVHPEGQDLEYFLLHGRVVVVQIRLVGVEAVEVILAALVIPGPIGGFHVGENDTDFGIALWVIAPNIEIAIGSGWIRAGGLKPWVIGAGVIER